MTATLDAAGKKLVVFSDTHLTHKFDQAKFNFLKQLIESADQVIINGDFWDKFETSFDKFINSSWQPLFRLLKSKQAIYIYGNHDLADYADQRVNAFSVLQVDECQVKVDKYIFRIQHGHKVVPSWDVKFGFLFRNQLMMKLGNIFQLIGAKLFKENFLLLFLDKNRRAKKNNYFLEDNQILVCGHTHLAELNLPKKYINNGVIRWGFANYLTIENDSFELIKTRYY